MNTHYDLPRQIADHGIHPQAELELKLFHKISDIDEMKKQITNRSKIQAKIRFRNSVYRHT